MGGTKRLLILFLAFQVFAALFSDAADAGWANTYGGAGYDWAYSTQQTSDGGYIVAGGADSFGAGVDDFWVLKLDSDGTPAWQKTYGGADYDAAYSIQQTSDGGYIVAGETDSFGAGGSDVWILKLKSDGTVAWQNTYGGSGYEWADSVRQTSDGGYIVAGGTDSFGAGFYDAWILKLKSDGTVAWQKTYGSAGYDGAYSIQQTSDGGYIVAGETDSFGAGGSDVWISKLKSDGTVAWQKTYGSAGFDWANAIQQTSDGGYIVTGGTNFFGAGFYDAWLLKLNSNGTVVWQNTYGSAGYDAAYSIQQTSDGGYIVAGETDSFGAGGGADAWILKLNSNGTVVWQNTYGSAVYDAAYSIQQTSDGGYIVAGGTDSSGTENYDFWVLKLDTNGDVAGCSLIGTSSAVVGNTAVTGINAVSWETATAIIPMPTSAIITGTSVNPAQICCPPAEAVIKFDTVSKDIKVYDSGTGSEAGYVVVQSKSSKSNKEHKDDDDDGDDNKGGWEKRKYTLSDCTGNALVLILKHKKEGKEAKVKVVSMQYGNGVVVEAVNNKIQAEYSEERNGSIKELEQKVYVKNQFEVKAKYKASNNKTEIKVKLEGQSEQKETRSGMVILEMLTNKGSLNYRY